MKLGELTQHPDYRLLLSEMQKELDKATESVVGASTSKDLGDIRFRAGGRAVLVALLDHLTEAKRKEG